MHAHGREAAGGLFYERHRPEQTQLYRLVAQPYPAFVTHLAEQGKRLPAYVEKDFDTYLKCGRLEHGFLRVRCESCHFERLGAFSFSVAVFAQAAAPGAWPTTAGPLRQWGF